LGRKGEIRASPASQSANPSTRTGIEVDYMVSARGTRKKGAAWVGSIRCRCVAMFMGWRWVYNRRISI